MELTSVNGHIETQLPGRSILLLNILQRSRVIKSKRSKRWCEFVKGTN